MVEYSQNEQKQNLLSAIRNCVSTFVGTISYWKGIGLAPEQGAEKHLRVSAINRIQSLFLPTFSGKTEKVGLRSNSCGLAVKMAVR